MKRLTDAQLLSVACGQDPPLVVANRYHVPVSFVLGVRRSVVLAERLHNVSMFTEMKHGQARNACSMIGATEETGPGAALTAAEALEPDLNRRSNP